MRGSDILLRVFAVLIALRGIDNILKSQSIERGLVFFGVQLTGTANAIMGPLFGIFMIAYAYGIWRMRRYALPAGIAYAVFAILNMLLFPIRTGLTGGAAWAIGYAVYAVVGVAVTVGAPWILYQRREQLH